MALLSMYATGAGMVSITWRFQRLSWATVQPSGNATTGCYYGYKLLALVTLNGIIIEWELMPAGADERDGLQAMMFDDEQWLLWADKGLLDHRRQQRLE